MEKKLGPIKREGEYEVYIGKPIRVGISSNGNAIGVLERTSSEYLSLKPSLINHGEYTKEGKLINHIIIDNEIPQKIKINSITHIEPLQQGYMEYLSNNLNKNSKEQNIPIYSKNFNITKSKAN